MIIKIHTENTHSQTGKGCLLCQCLLKPQWSVRVGLTHSLGQSTDYLGTHFKELHCEVSLWRFVTFVLLL